MKEIMEIELIVELLEWSNPSMSIVPPTQKDS
jgi:hypothetical protein